MKKALWLFLTLACSAALPSQAITEAENELIGSGGGVSGSPSFLVSYSMGQPVSDTAESATLHLDPGFWPANFLSPMPAAIEGDGVLPVVYRLYQNAPNPFNPLTTIKYDLPEDVSCVTLRLYDLRGRLVRTLVSGPERAGAKSIVWRGLDDRGQSVATGVYFYVLQTTAFQSTCKLLLVR